MLSFPHDPPVVAHLGAGVTRRATVLADGRELFYYDDAESTLGPDRGADVRALPTRPATATMRQDPLTGEWITFATARQHRAVLPAMDPLAPQQPGAPSEIPGQYDVAVFENRSPAFGPALGGEQHDGQTPDGQPGTPEALGIGRTRTSVGRCEVVCFSPERTGSFGTQTSARARTVIEAWADRTAALAAMPGIEQVFPFENRGEEIGVTLSHPHGQIYGYPYVTPRTRQLLGAIDRSSPDLLARVLDFERASDRTVLSGEHWTAFVPFAARWPLEVHLMPHRHAADFTELTSGERDELAGLYLRLLRGVDALYSTPTPYIAAWHQAPVRVGRDTVRMRLELTSPRRSEHQLKYLAGSESAMAAWTAELLPEDTAARLRSVIPDSAA